MKKYLQILMAIGLVGLVVSCNRGKQDDDGKPTVALVLKTLNNPYFIDMEKGAQEAADRLGINLIVQAADRELDVERQMQICENLIQRKVDALCVTPSGTREIIPAIVKANASGIPVIIVDTQADLEALAQAGGKTASFIGSDNYEGGKIAGVFLAGQLKGKGKVAILEGIPGHETADSRRKGFLEAIAASPGIEVVTSQPANWERDQGFNVFQNMLQAHSDITGLFAASDLMALGAMEAIAAAGKTGQITIVGFDALDEAKEAIEKGTMAGTIAQHPDEMGKAAIENAYKILQGESIEKHIAVSIELVTKLK
ncbi:MAG: sugar ABC transporter substrate-binding protein [Verrucomicrobia bacterium]|nr:sugar ABC transporter substrate-binding protein [Verrucomicrobiota bacterium]MDA1065859.1 sugar ABC transporter substrate-binding protein [Verrucomicrobiota bacterium]